MEKILPLDNWDKNKVYHSPSGEVVKIFVDGKWTTFVREDVVSNQCKNAIDAFVKAQELHKKMSH